jgi:hypothetical protein
MTVLIYWTKRRLLTKARVPTTTTTTTTPLAATPTQSKQKYNVLPPLLASEIPPCGE